VEFVVLHPETPRDARDKDADVDPLLAELERELQKMLDELASESRLYVPIDGRPHC
jgi:hypothetical protein